MKGFLRGTVLMLLLTFEVSRSWVGGDPLVTLIMKKGKKLKIQCEDVQYRPCLMISYESNLKGSVLLLSWMLFFVRKLKILPESKLNYFTFINYFIIQYSLCIIYLGSTTEIGHLQYRNSLPLPRALNIIGGRSIHIL